jgi:hypothetical protein
VLPALLLIPLAASTGHRGRQALSVGLLAGSCALYAAVLATVD